MSHDTSAAPWRPLCGLEVTKALLSVAQGLECHLVGGALRDSLLEREPRDLDFIVSGDGKEIAERLAEKLSARLVPLGGSAFSTYRLVTKTGVIDLLDRGAKPLVEELRRRDFTINAMALDLGTCELVDPLGGREDITRRCLRQAGARSLRSDPVRVLRLARLLAELPGFKVDMRTANSARAAAVGLGKIPSERLRQELALLFESPGASRGIALLIELDVFPTLWLPQSSAGAPRSRQILADLKSLQEVMSHLRDRGEDVGLEDTQMALLFMNLPLDGAGSIGDLLRFGFQRGLISRSQKRTIEPVLAWQNLPEDTEQLRWFLAQQGENWPTATAALGAHSVSAGAPVAIVNKKIDSLIDIVQRDGEAIFNPAPLLDGVEIQDLWKIAPGPLLGRAIDQVRRAQVTGRIGNREEAIALLESWLGSRPEE